MPIKALSKKCRQVLYDWPKGQKRKFKFGHLTWEKDLTYISTGQIDFAIAQNYLTGCEFKDKHHSRGLELVRTDRPVKPYRPRGPKRNYTGPFPWSVEEHWRRVERHPINVARKVTMKLTDTRRYNPEILLGYPVIQSASMLNEWRKGLVCLFSKGASELRYVPSNLGSWLYTGEQIYLVCMMMLVRPEFRKSEFVRFVAIEPEEAQREILQRIGESGEPRDRYLQWLTR